MSEALIASLQAEINRLNQTLMKVRGEAKDRRERAEKLDAELATVKTELGTLRTAHTALEAKAATEPTEASARIAELEAQVRTRDHRDAFAEVKEFEVPGEAGTAGKKYTLRDGVKPDDVWTLTQYKAEGERPTAQAVTAKYVEAQRAKAYLFAEVAANGADAPPNPTTVPRREAGPGARTSSPTTTVTPSVAAQVDADYGNRPIGRIA